MNFRLDKLTGLKLRELAGSYKQKALVSDRPLERPVTSFFENDQMVFTFVFEFSPSDLSNTLWNMEMDLLLDQILDCT